MDDSRFLKGHILMAISSIFFSFNFIMLKYMMPRIKAKVRDIHAIWKIQHAELKISVVP